MRFRKDTDGFRAEKMVCGWRQAVNWEKAGDCLEGGEGIQVRDVCWATALSVTLETLVKFARDVTSRDMQSGG